MGRQYSYQICYSVFLKPRGSPMGSILWQYSIWTISQQISTQWKLKKQYKKIWKASHYSAFWDKWFVIRKNSSFLFLKLQMKPCGFSFKSRDFLSTERHERIAQGKSHIVTDSLQLANLTNSFPAEGRKAPCELERTWEVIFLQMKNLR